MKKKVSRIIWGLCLILVGAFYALDSFDILNINLFFNGWWTLFIIVPSLVGIFCDKLKSVNVFFFVFGLSLLFYCLEIIRFENVFDIAFCLLFILFGVKLVFGNTEKADEIDSRGNVVSTYLSVFGGSKEILKSDVLNYKIVSIFGHSSFDLSKVSLKDDVNIRIYTIFGSCDLLTREEDYVSSNLFNVIGRFKNKSVKKKKKVVIYLNGFTLFGGVFVKNKRS